MDMLHHKVMIPLILGVVLLAAILALGSRNTQPASQQATPTAKPTVAINYKLLTTTYSGTLPCADCSGLETRLSLTKSSEFSAEGTYVLKETYVGKDVKPLETKGDWTTLRGTPTNENATVYELNPDKKEDSRYFLKDSDDEIKMLNKDLNEIESPTMNFSLKRVK